MITDLHLKRWADILVEQVTGSPGVSSSEFQGFDSLRGTIGAYIFGEGLGLESLDHTARGSILTPLSPSTPVANPLTITAATDGERLRELAGGFSFTTHFLSYFSQDQSSISLNFDEQVSTSFADMNLKTSSFPGEVFTYRIVSGPSWLAIDSNGLLTGSPSLADFGTHTFVIEVEDENGAIDTLNLDANILSDTFRSISEGTSTGDLRLSWPSAPGLTFDLVSSQTLDTPPSQWTVYMADIPAHATEARTSFDIPAPDQARFFSVRFAP